MQILLSDYDGTLRFHGKPYRAEDITAIERFQQAGNKYVINTGRGYNQILPSYPGPHPVNFDLVIADSGASMVKGEIVLEEHPIPFSLIEEIVETFPDASYTFSCDGLFCLVDDLDHTGRFPEANRFKSLKELEGHSIQTISFHLQTVDEALQAAKKIEEMNWPIGVQVNRESIDCNAPGFSKACAIEKAMKHFKADFEDVWAIGDSHNDLPALRAAHRAFLVRSDDAKLMDLAVKENIRLVDSVAEAIDIIMNEEKNKEE